MLRCEIYPTKKPDADNIAKVILDALNGIAYRDDTQVVDLTVSMRYGTYSAVFVEIQEVDNNGH
jgi:Holliday junction resolvase RusA-like endonuclease